MSSQTEPLIFQHSVEGLIRALGDRLDHDTSARLKQAGLDVNRLQPAYPLQTWVALMRLASEIISPGKPLPEAMFECGRRFFDGFGDTFMGRALIAMIRVIGPARTLQRMTRNFRTGNNYTETLLREVARNEYELWCSQVVHAEWYRGLITAALTASGAKNLSVVVGKHDETGATFQIKFD